MYRISLDRLFLQRLLLPPEFALLLEATDAKLAPGKSEQLFAAADADRDGECTPAELGAALSEQVA